MHAYYCTSKYANAKRYAGLIACMVSCIISTKSEPLSNGGGALCHKNWFFWVIYAGRTESSTEVTHQVVKDLCNLGTSICLNGYVYKTRQYACVLLYQQVCKCKEVCRANCMHGFMPDFYQIRTPLGWGGGTGHM
jgi:hypothetical protein